MSDTTTPSAAEVMGFLPEHEFIDGGPRCSWCDTHIDCVDAEVGPHCPDNIAPPTPDDMLAWLREQGYNVSVGVDLDADEYEVSVGQPGEVMTPFYDDTIHAALEQAVIAVGCAEPECRCYTIHEPMNAACPRNA